MTPHLTAVNFIVLHHSVTPPDWTIADIERLHAARGFHWSTPDASGHCGYHRLYLPDGTIQQARPIHLQGAHCGPKRGWPGLNAVSIGLCAIGDFTSRGWYSPQAVAILDDIEALCREHGLTAGSVIGHREYEGAATECPGLSINMTAVRVEIAHRLVSRLTEPSAECGIVGG